MPSTIFATDICVFSRVPCSVIKLQESCPCQIIHVSIDEGVLNVLLEIIDTHEELAIIQHNRSSLLSQSRSPKTTFVAPVSPVRLLAPWISHLNKPDAFTIKVMKFLNTNDCVGVALCEAYFILSPVITWISGTCDNIVVLISGL